MSAVDLPENFILIVAPCPIGAEVVEGWMGRIRAVDAIFGDQPRVYVDPYTRPADGPAAPRRHGDLATEFRLDPLEEEHAALLETLILRARFVYVHTMHLGRYLLPYYPTGKIVTDVHGIVPEEERMLGNPAAGDFYEGVERVIVMHSRVMVVVTNAMKDHLLAKHPDCPAEFVVLPIAELAATTNFVRRKRAEGEKFRVLYAGGTQVWQDIGLTLETAARAASFCDFEFLEPPAPGDPRTRRRPAYRNERALHGLWQGRADRALSQCRLRLRPARRHGGQSCLLSDKTLRIPLVRADPDREDGSHWRLHKIRLCLSDLRGVRARSDPRRVLF